MGRNCPDPAESLPLTQKSVGSRLPVVGYMHPMQITEPGSPPSQRLLRPSNRRVNEAHLGGDGLLSGRTGG